MRSGRVVWLLRSGEEADPYEAALAEAGFEGRSLPVLRFERVHGSELRHALEHPKRYSGLIFTSPRAVEAFTDAMPWLPSEAVSWHNKSIFAVGPRTADELRKIGFQPEGEESGSAGLLVHYIVEKHFDKPLLFLCGDKRRDELPDQLQAHSIPVEELCVYISVPSPDLDFSGLPAPDWVAFFSPSGLDSVRTITELDLSTVRIAAIGSTTASALEREGYLVDAIAKEPSPGGLAAAILAASGAGRDVV